jgi:hypothetical protein
MSICRLRHCGIGLAVAGAVPFAGLDWFWTSISACAALLGVFAAIELGGRARRQPHE